MKRKNILVTLADENCIDAAKQLFASAYFYGGWDEDMMLLAHAPSFENKKEELDWFREKGINIRMCKDYQEKSKAMYPSTLYAKFYMFTEEFKKWDNIIYLDADIIVRFKLDYLKDTSGFNAIEDFPFTHNLEHQFWKMKNHSLQNQDYNPNKVAFNSGVMAFSSDIIKDNTFYELIELTRRYEGLLRFKDQSVLNLYFYKKWKPLPLVFNTMGSKNKLEWSKSDRDKGAILHFAYKDKPWNKDNPLNYIWTQNLGKANYIGTAAPKKRDISSIKISVLSFRQHLLRTIKLLKYYPKRTYEQVGGKIRAELSNFLKEKRKDIRKYLRDLIKDIRISFKTIKKKMKTDLQIIYENIINKNIGKMGILLKYKFPKVYIFLKRNDNHEKKGSSRDSSR